MPRYEVVVTRTTIEIGAFIVTAKDETAAEEKVRAKLEPTGDEVTEKIEKAARRYFENHPADNADNSTEFEYQADEI